ncbi:predicted protein [Plenodomus lingam JN3]|uniref:Predicted protein n=1 Tax=Leptosphaeria maculans (strain JN3 / isolate v23.1.3 / race Av1-4-5-6-7-8) TaxID=985895 RepID=E4ZVE0_LEPMJ|nr:predicted protein [Plenodomus lingam JN3]CBX95566.1 predicted protein [Plenodomus lingam JN3]
MNAAIPATPHPATPAFPPHNIRSLKAASAGDCGPVQSHKPTSTCPVPGRYHTATPYPNQGHHETQILGLGGFPWCVGWYRLEG